MISDDDRHAIEASFTLLSRAAGLASEEAEEVAGFVRAGEYGLGLETLVAAVVEDGADQPTLFEVLARFVASLLGLPEPPLADQLAARSRADAAVTA